LLNVTDQIVGVLDADRQPHQLWCDAGGDFVTE